MQIDQIMLLNNSNNPRKKQSRDSWKSQILKQKQRNIQLLNQVGQLKKQNKRLNGLIEKMTSQQRNAELYFETAMKQLQAANQQYKVILEASDSQQLKFKKSSNMSQSKLNRSALNSSYITSKYSLQNKENINSQNISQNRCNNLSCQARQELQIIKNYSTLILNSLQNLIYSIKGRMSKLCQNQNYQKWVQYLQDQLNERKSYGNKSSLQLLKIVQQKMKKLGECLEGQLDRSQFENEKLLKQMNILKLKQKTLIKIPFLQKIDVNQRKQDANCFIQSGYLMRDHILKLLKLE